MTTATINPEQTPLPYPVIDHGDRLGLTIFFALVLHSLIILGVSFAVPDEVLPPEKLPGLEVTLVQSKTDKKIEDADFLAQANQEGGGDSEEISRPTAPVEPVVATGEAGDVSQFVPETVIPSSADPQGMQIITADSSKDKIDADTSDPDIETDFDKMTPIQLLSRSKEIAKLSAEIDQSRKSYASKPRKAFTSARTKEYRFASYEESWRKKIERIGTLNFPDEARRNKLSGSLRMSVTIDKSGNIKNITINNYSGHKVLDDAAVRVVKMAAPFPKLPDDITKDFDEIVIIRTWQFLPGNKLKTER